LNPRTAFEIVSFASPHQLHRIKLRVSTTTKAPLMPLMCPKQRPRRIPVSDSRTVLIDLDWFYPSTPATASNTTSSPAEFVELKALL
jgi:hypothetical protein